MSKPILISISPNTNCSDVVLAFKTLLQPWRWQTGKALSQLNIQLKSQLQAKHCWLLNSGRSALYLALKVLNLDSTDEVLCQAFTCVAVPNAILWADAKPVFVDTVKNGFNLSIKDLQKKITSKSKALIIQHTFGQPDDLQAIKQLCKKHKLILIEDCAHSLGATYQGKPVGGFGDITMLSFGRDKVISSVFGGALLTSNQALAKKINKLASNLPSPSYVWIYKQLLHPLIMTIITPLYFFLNIGKFLLFLYQKSRLLTFPVSSQEKACQMSLKPQLLPNALAKLALHQLNKLAKINQQRQQLAKHYLKALKLPSASPGSIYLRLPLLVNKPQSLINLAKKHHVLLGNWYRPVIAPQGVDLNKLGYKTGSCPQAEAVSQQVVNLPTHPKMTLKQAQRVVKIVKSYANH